MLRDSFVIWVFSIGAIKLANGWMKHQCRNVVFVNALNPFSKTCNQIWIRPNVICCYKIEMVRRAPWHRFMLNYANHANLWMQNGPSAAGDNIIIYRHSVDRLVFSYRSAIIFIVRRINSARISFWCRFVFTRFSFLLFWFFPPLPLLLLWLLVLHYYYYDYSSTTIMIKVAKKWNV